MNARLAAAVTALETIVIVGIGVGIFFAPLAVVWAFDDRFSTDLLDYWRAAADLWLLGHGVPLSVTLPLELAESLGLGESGQSFVLSLAPLGPAVLTFWWGFRMGRRELVIEFPLLVWLVSLLTHTVLSMALWASSTHDLVTSRWDDALLRPTLFLAAGLLVASWSGEWSIGRFVAEERLGERTWTILRAGATAGVGALSGMAAVTGVFFAGLLVSRYAEVIALFEALKPSLVGIVALQIAQLALFPTVIVWVFSWLVGPGFSLGLAATFSPLGTQVQAVPALPVLAALPQATTGLIIVVLPVVVAAVTAALATPSLHHAINRPLWFPVQETPLLRQPVVRILLASVVSTTIAVVALWVPLSLASGSAGPGRFQVAGAPVEQVLLWWGVEVAVGSLIGFFAAEGWVRLRAAEARYVQEVAR